MIYIGRAIEGISLNGLEWLLEGEEGDFKSFESKDDAKQFLRENGYDDFSDEEMEDTFVFADENEVNK